MKDNIQRTYISIIFIWLVLGLEMVLMLIHVWEFHILNQINAGVDIPMKDIANNDIRHFFISFIHFIVLVFSVIYFIRWFRRAYFNIHSLNFAKLRFKEGWAVGSWFVPGFNLVAPYLIMDEIWKTAGSILTQKLDMKLHPSKTLILTWWILWILALFLGTLIIQNLMEASNIQENIRIALVNIFSSMLWIPLTIVTYYMMKTYNTMEKILFFNQDSIKEQTAP